MNNSNFNYTDTDSIRIKADCDFCRNAYTCDELSHDNDLSYMGCGSTEKGFRMLFKSGDKRPTQLIVEQLLPSGINFQKLEWNLVGVFEPQYCPFCGRRLVENMFTRRNKMYEINVTNNERAFVALARRFIKREGIEDLLEHLQTETDFFYAPCSTRYHLCVEGGLVEHSLHVDEIFDALCDKFMPDFPVESRHLCALFHDLCKYHCYDPAKKSRKTGRLLPNGKPEWEDYMGYDFIEEFPYGHGEKSVYLLQKYIKLTDEEAMVIRWHMGFSDSTFKGGQQSVSNAMKLYPVIALLHSADIIATSTEE